MTQRLFQQTLLQKWSQTQLGVPFSGGVLRGRFSPLVAQKPLSCSVFGLIARGRWSSPLPAQRSLSLRLRARRSRAVVFTAPCATLPLAPSSGTSLENGGSHGWLHNALSRSVFGHSARRAVVLTAGCTPRALAPSSGTLRAERWSSTLVAHRARSLRLRPTAHRAFSLRLLAPCAQSGGPQRWLRTARSCSVFGHLARRAVVLNAGCAPRALAPSSAGCAPRALAPSSSPLRAERWSSPLCAHHAFSLRLRAPCAQGGGRHRWLRTARSCSVFGWWRTARSRSVVGHIARRAVVVTALCAPRALAPSSATQLVGYRHCFGGRRDLSRLLRARCFRAAVRNVDRGDLRLDTEGVERRTLLHGGGNEAIPRSTRPGTRVQARRASSPVLQLPNQRLPAPSRAPPRVRAAAEPQVVRRASAFPLHASDASCTICEMA